MNPLEVVYSVWTSDGREFERPVLEWTVSSNPASRAVGGRAPAREICRQNDLESRIGDTVEVEEWIGIEG